MKIAHPMKLLRAPLLQVLFLIIFFGQVYANHSSGFFLPDSIQEMTLKFRSIKNLIIIPVMINQTTSVNLILDTGCRNLVLFGKKFSHLVQKGYSREVEFSGLGSGEPVRGHLSINNHVSIESITGTNLPIVVVTSKNFFSRYPSIDGIIGYDIFLKFEIEINPQTQTIKFRPAASAQAPENYLSIPLKIVDSKPILQSDIQFQKNQNQSLDLMIDTGSVLGLLLKTTDTSLFTEVVNEMEIGTGLNGPLFGVKTTADRVRLNGFEMTRLPAGITRSEWHNYASIGMGILKDYILVLNYCKAYACLKKLS
jgi:hypothetical protein